MLGIPTIFCTDSKHWIKSSSLARSANIFPRKTAAQSLSRESADKSAIWALIGVLRLGLSGDFRPWSEISGANSLSGSLPA
jgi:hypothetical protein